MADTKIEWTSKVWNPTTGCDKVSAGCDNCYALTMAGRLKAMGSAHYQTDGDPRTSGPGFGVAVHPDALGLPLRWRRPQLVFVNSMSDLFHARVPRDFIISVWDVMAQTPQHTYQILTKRPERAARVLAAIAGRDLWPLPLTNVWLGVSVENQEQVDRRIPALLDTAASLRWISAEPLLGSVDLSPYLPDLDWVVCGGESGPRARIMAPAWARSLRDQCTGAGVPFFFKQWGAWAPNGARGIGRFEGRERLVGPVIDDLGHREVVERQTSKSGRVLDGRTWDQYPDTKVSTAA